MAAMLEFIQRLPKAELHVHLEGSLEPETLREIDPSITPDEVRQRYAYHDFGGFLKAFAWVAGRLRGPREYGIAAQRLLERLESQNVRYAEITVAAGVALWLGLDLAGIHQQLTRIAARSRVQTWWIWDITRQWGPVPAYAAMEMAVERRGDGVIGFGMGGDEARGPALWYRDVFRRARDGGLRLVCHAGESTDAQSIRDALEIGAERIGHGIAAHTDASLLSLLAERGVPLEISITSNIRTGVVPSLASHPVRKIFDAGVPVVLNTDDPPMFATSLNEEYAKAAEHFAFTAEELQQLAANGFRHAFAWPENSRPYAMVG